ncbi:hypothetical protein G6F31_020344 [Rhizopus arrhizus]|nr:hypothetical protein G6F31_020344 [Rhizopus arrhizus]
MREPWLDELADSATGGENAAYGESSDLHRQAHPDQKQRGRRPHETPTFPPCPPSGRCCAQPAPAPAGRASGRSVPANRPLPANRARPLPACPLRPLPPASMATRGGWAAGGRVP